VVSGTKDPARVESGRRGALKRWSNPANRRVVRLDRLDPDTARLIRALLAQRPAEDAPTTPEAA
jgi:hypothetical protein